jgi:hypothetical protein
MGAVDPTNTLIKAVPAFPTQRATSYTSPSFSIWKRHIIHTGRSDDDGRDDAGREPIEDNTDVEFNFGFSEKI